MKTLSYFKFPIPVGILGILFASNSFAQTEEYWKTDGNNANSSSFIGTKNNQDLRLRTNDEERMIITEEGNVGIGTSYPDAKFHLKGRAIIDSFYVNDTAVFHKSVQFKENVNITGNISLEEGNIAIPSIANEEFYEQNMLMIDKDGNLVNGGGILNLIYASEAFNPNSEVECLPNAQGYVIYPPHWTAKPKQMYFKNTTCNQDPKLGVGIAPTAKVHIQTARFSNLEHLRIERIDNDNNPDLLLKMEQDGKIYSKNNIGVGIPPGSARVHIFSGDTGISPIIVGQDEAGSLPPYLKLSPTGLLGIGTNPSAKLHVLADASPLIHPLLIEKPTDGAAPIKLLQLENSGLLRAREVKVDLDSWPDYVFDKNYDLMPLNEVKAFVEENGHLPNVPKAIEIEKDGINLGDAAKTAMEKIEELTLYLFELNEKLEEQEQQLQQQNELINLQQNTIDLQKQLLEELQNLKK